MYCEKQKQNFIKSATVSNMRSTKNINKNKITH